MPDLDSPGGGAVPSARKERRRIITDDAAGIAMYSTAIGLVSAIILAIVIVA
jgi:hypothetical protein